MQIPNPETKAMMRNLSSCGSDDSLTSILDKVNSYSKDSDIEEDLKKKEIDCEQNFNTTFSTNKENDEKLMQRLNTKNEDDDTSRYMNVNVQLNYGE